VGAEPSTVTVAGPESRLTGAITAMTERVMIQGRTGRVVQEVVVGVDDPQIRVHAPRTVRVTVQIDPASSRPAVAPMPRSGDR